MRQRLGLAAALLGDPEVLVLDEPANGLDPDGIHWLRDVLRGLAADGRTVLVSSHVLAEVAQTVDEVVMIRDGELVAQAPLDDLLRGGQTEIQIRTLQIKALRAALGAAGVSSSLDGSGRLRVRGATAEEVGRIAARAGAVLLELHAVERSLEDVFLQRTTSKGDDQ